MSADLDMLFQVIIVYDVLPSLQRAVLHFSVDILDFVVMPSNKYGSGNLYFWIFLLYKCDYLFQQLNCGNTSS